jgi:hypothetical protein
MEHHLKYNKNWHEQLTLDDGKIINNTLGLNGYGLYLGYLILDGKINELIKKTKINSDVDVYYTMSCKGCKTFKKNDLDYKMFQASLSLAKLHYKNIHLVTDNEGASILKELPFTTIDCSLETKMPYSMPSCWTLPKVFTYQIASKKNKPFIHIDNDLFLFGAIPEEELDHPIVAEQDEINCHGYNIEHFVNNLTNKYFYQDFLNYKVDNAANTSLFGGTDLEFINLYSEQVINMCLDEQNKKFLSNNDPNVYKGCCLEQYSLSFLAKKHNKKINFLLKSFDEFGNYNNLYKDAFEQKRWHFAETKYMPIGETIIDKLLCLL